jgi:two-component SAPR family response regulator
MDDEGRDVKPLTNKSKADKIVFEQKDKWVIVEAAELHSFIITHRLKEINLDEIIDALEWNININK